MCFKGGKLESLKFMMFLTYFFTENAVVHLKVKSINGVISAVLCTLDNERSFVNYF